MAFERGRFGIEYDPRQRDRESPGFGWALAAVGILALASLAWTVFSRMRAAAGDEEEAPPPPPAAEAARPPDVPPPPPPARKFGDSDMDGRPLKVRNLLMRLEEAEKRRDAEMAVAAIEQIRALPGSPAADLDDALARRLGALNVRRLFTLKNPQWVKSVTVKRGDSASRIAAENGASLASFARLNGGDVDKVAVGAKVWVMDHPRFNLVLHRRTRTADLSLNGKFFKRYDLAGEVKGKDGAYGMTARPRAFWRLVGAEFSDADRRELETLLPPGASVIVADL